MTSRVAGRADSAEIVELSPAENSELFDQVAKREMGMNGTEFLRRWDSGEWEGVDFDTVPGLVTVWMYLPFARER